MERWAISPFRYTDRKLVSHTYDSTLRMSADSTRHIHKNLLVATPLTLLHRYADRARHIRNKPVVNRDPMAAQVCVCAWRGGGAGR